MSDLAITFLCENEASAMPWKAEWGFSAWIEHRGTHILFDTGFSDVWRFNADHAGLDLETVDLWFPKIATTIAPQSPVNYHHSRLAARDRTIPSPPFPPFLCPPFPPPFSSSPFCCSALHLSSGASLPSRFSSSSLALVLSVI